MREKFSIVIFFIILFISLSFSSEKKNLFLVLNFRSSLELNEIYFINYIFDYSINKIMQENDSINIFTNGISLETDNIKKIATYVATKKGIGFFFVDCGIDESNISLNLVLYSFQSEKLYEQKITISDQNFDKNIMNTDILNSIIEAMLKGIDIILKKDYNIFSLNIKKKDFFKHDFPLLNIMLSAVSVRFYFDARTNSKLFSFFPVNLFLTFYPLRYFEIGTFISFDFDDLIFRYKEDNSNNYYYYYSSFIFSYGFFAGFSFFFDIYHFSLGFSFYNIYYYLSENSGFKKTEDYNSYFLPQISFYEKLDIKVFKVLNYSIFFSLKTLPLFIKQQNYFYSNPFLFDFVIIEFSILGFSITL